MALLIDALNKADHDRQARQKALGLALEDEVMSQPMAQSASEASERSTPPLSPPSAPSGATAKPSGAVFPQTSRPATKDTANASIPPRYTTAPLPSSSPFRGALALLVLIVLSVIGLGVYWMFSPQSGIRVNVSSSRDSSSLQNRESVSPGVKTMNNREALGASSTIDSYNDEPAAPPMPAPINRIAEPAPSEDRFNATKMVRSSHQGNATHSVPFIRADESPTSANSSSVNTSRDPSISTVQKLRTNPNDLLARALIQLEERRYAEARASYLQVLRYDPQHSEALQNLGIIAYNTGNIVQAQEYWHKLLQHRPDHDFARQSLAAVSTDSPQVSVSVDAPREDAGSTDHIAGHRHYIQGVRLAEQQLWAEAQNQFFIAWSEQSDNPDYAYNLAVSLDHLGQGEQAIKFYHRALANAKKQGTPPAQFSIKNANSRLQYLLNGE